MKKIFLLLLALCLPSYAQNQPALDQLQSTYITVGTLPSTVHQGQLELINDANPDCSTGGGAGIALCRWNGASWDTVIGNNAGPTTTGSGATVLQNAPVLNGPTIQGGATADSLTTAKLIFSNPFLVQSSASGNTDRFGQITLVTGAGSYNFQGTYSTAPICFVSDPAHPSLGPIWSTTTSALTLTSGNGTDVVNYQCVGASSGGLTIATASLPDATSGTAYSQTLTATGGTPPYTWTVPSGTIPGGAVDVLDYACMPLPDRNAFHLSGNAVKYCHVDGGLLWWLKGSTGTPWDGEMYDGSWIYQWFTEGDSSNNAACQAAGYSSCFTDPFANKMYGTPVPLWPRFHVPANDDIKSTPGPNLYVQTTNCGADHQPAINNLDIKGELQGPFTDVTWHTTYGGSIPDGTPYLLATKFYKGTAGVYQNREQYWLVLGYGQVRWCPASWNGSGYTVGTCSTNTSKVSGGAPTPNFACKVPTLPTTGILPPGTLSSASPSLNLGDSTGKISGVPTTPATNSFTAQVEDANGNVAQKNLSIVVH